MGLFDKFKSKKSKEAKGKPKFVVEDKIKIDLKKVATKTQTEGKKTKDEDIKARKKEEKVTKKEQKLGADQLPKTTKDSGQAPVTTKGSGQAYRVLIKPQITEKSSSLGMYNQYVFEVAPKVNKIEVSKAIQALYGVKPLKVNVMNVRGKKVRFGKTRGKAKNWRKAVVTLKEGEKINVYEGV